MTILLWTNAKETSLLYKQVSKLIHAKPGQAICVGNNIQYPKHPHLVSRSVALQNIKYSLVLVSRIIVVRDVSLELLNQERSALCATAFVSDGIFNHNLVQHGAVVEFDQERIADGTAGRLVVLDGERLVFDTVNLGAQRIDAGIRRRLVGVRLGRELAMDERVSDHVADGVTRNDDSSSFASDLWMKRETINILSVCKVVQRTLLVDDADGGFLSADTHALDVVGRFA